jgi:hypothetical protein
MLEKIDGQRMTADWRKTISACNNEPLRLGKLNDDNDDINARRSILTLVDI